MIGTIGDDTIGKRLEVAVEDGEILLRTMNYSSGLGWCVQKTIRIEPQHLHELQFLLNAAASILKFGSQKKKQAVSAKSATVIPFSLTA